MPRAHVDVTGDANLLQYAEAVTGARRNYVIVLAVAAAVILTIGSLLRPAPDAQRGPDPTPSDLERLAQLSRRRAVEDAARYFTSVADRSAASLVHLDGAGLTGVVWAPGLVVTAAPDSPVSSTSNVTALGQAHAGETGGGGPTLPLLTLRAASLPSLPAARADARTLETGAWVLAVWRTDDQRAFASGHFVGVSARSSEFLRWDEVTSTVVLTDDMRGGGLFDLDGRLLGVILPADDGLSVIAASSVDALLAEADTLEAQLLARYGMRVATLTEAEREHLGVDEGLLVQAVWDGYPADRSGLAPGDVIVSLDGTPVRALEDLSRLTAMDPPAAPVLEVRWRSVSRQVPLTSRRGPAEEDARSTGLGWEAEPQGYRIADVPSGSRAAEAGLRTGDRLLRVDRVEPQSLGQVERLLAEASGRPRFLEVRRGARRIGVLWNTSRPSA